MALQRLWVVCCSCFFMGLAGSVTRADERFSRLSPLTQAGPRVLQDAPSGRARVWVFLSSRCPCSHSHLGKLKEAFKSFSSRGFEFIGVHSNQDEPLTEAKAYFQAADLGFPVFSDPDAKAADFFGALKTPHVFIESRNHQILFEGGIDDSRQAGSTSANYLSDALVELDSGRPVSRPRVRSLGCIISRRKKT